VAVRTGWAEVRGERHFVDTGAWFAYVNAADPDHERLRSILDRPPGRLVTSTYVFDETVTLTQARLGHRQAVTVGRALLDLAVVELMSVAPADERAAWSLFEKRADKAYSFTDCTSFVLMRREKIAIAVALDEHFSQEGFAVVPPRSPRR
jgi:predicted nucleic acid-binding protein